LTVTPAEICPNDPVDVNWSAEGQVVQLRQDPPMSLADPGRDSRDGVQGVSGDKDFDVVLEARTKGSPDVAQRRYVHVVTEAWTFVLTGSAVCSGNTAMIEVDFHVSDPQIDARMQVVTAVPRTDRALTIEHAGLPAITLPPGATTAFRGTPMGGLWRLTTALKKGESCAAAGKPPPAAALIVSGTCSGLPRVVQRGSKSANSAPRCGFFGQSCCDGGRCEGSYQCDDAKICRDTSRPSVVAGGERCSRKPATELSRTYFVGIRDANKCGQLLPQLADSVEEANACARAAGGASSNVVDGGRLGQFDFCKNRRTQLFIPAFSEEDGAECARRKFPRARVVPGLCEQ
jgi:hypothetical protein